jgi:hypothetical protein
MKLLAALLLLPLALSCQALGEDLKRLSLDDASSIGLRIETDVNEKVEGKASVKITTQWPTTVCLGEVSGLDVENAKLVYRARVKSALEGTAYLEMWAHVGTGQFFSRGMDSTVGGREGWNTIQTRFLLQKGQKASKVTLNLVINGQGMVWVDDLVVSKEPLN